MHEILLINPPFTNIFQPYIAIPQLVSYLQANSIDAVEMDANIDVIRKILCEETLRQSQAELLEKYRTNKSFDNENVKSLLSISGRIVDNIEKAISAIGKGGGIDEHVQGLYYTNLALALFAANYEHCSMHNAGFSIEYESRVESFSHIYSNTHLNPLVPIIIETILPEVVNMRPGKVGISITYNSQFHTGLQLAKLIKENCPNVYITVGGAYVSYMHDVFEKDNSVFRYIDSVIFGEGEQQLLEIVKSPVLCRGIKKNDYVHNSKVEHVSSEFVHDLDELQAPTYDPTYVNKYILSKQVLLLTTSRGCYWGKCAFCSTSSATNKCYRRRSPGRVFQDMVALHKKHNCSCFFLSDDSIHVNYLTELSNLIISSQFDFKWMCETRFDKAFTQEKVDTIKEGGCVSLLFGLESRSDRILEKINKGVCNDWVDEVVSYLREANIKPCMLTFIGFPGETQDEALLTIDYLISNADFFLSCGFTTFQMLHDSPISMTPEKYGASKKHHNLFDECIPYTVDTGMTPEEVTKVARKHIGSIRTAYLNSFLLRSESNLFAHFCNIKKEIESDQLTHEHIKPIILTEFDDSYFLFNFTTHKATSLTKEMFSTIASLLA